MLTCRLMVRCPVASAAHMACMILVEREVLLCATTAIVPTDESHYGHQSVSSVWIIIRALAGRASSTVYMVYGNTGATGSGCTSACFPFD